MHKLPLCSFQLSNCFIFHFVWSEIYDFSGVVLNTFVKIGLSMVEEKFKVYEFFILGSLTSFIRHISIVSRKEVYALSNFLWMSLIQNDRKMKEFQNFKLFIYKYKISNWIPIEDRLSFPPWTNELCSQEILKVTGNVMNGRWAKFLNYFIDIVHTVQLEFHNQAFSTIQLQVSNVAKKKDDHIDGFFLYLSPPCYCSDIMTKTFLS